MGCAGCFAFILLIGGALGKAISQSMNQLSEPAGWKVFPKCHYHLAWTVERQNSKSFFTYCNSRLQNYPTANCRLVGLQLSLLLVWLLDPDAATSDTVVSYFRYVCLVLVGSCVVLEVGTES